MTEPNRQDIRHQVAIDVDERFQRAVWELFDSLSDFLSWLSYQGGEVVFEDDCAVYCSVPSIFLDVLGREASLSAEEQRCVTLAHRKFLDKTHINIEPAWNVLVLRKSIINGL